MPRDAAIVFLVRAASCSMGLSHSFPGHPSLRLVSFFRVMFLLGVVRVFRSAPWP